MKIKTLLSLPFSPARFKISDWDISTKQPFFNLDLTRNRYPNIALQLDGGGIKGLMVAYQLHVIQEKTGDICRWVDHYYGTSTGAILAASLAFGVSPKELLRFYVEEGPRIFKMRCLWGGFRGSIYNPRRLLSLMKKRFGDTTFQDLHQSRGKSLTIVSVEATEQKVFFCNHQNTPKMRLVDAVMGSVSVPIIFPPHQSKEGIFYDGFLGGLGSCVEHAYEDLTIRKRWQKEKSILISFGTGATRPVLSIKEVKKMNKAENLTWMLSGILEAMVTRQLESIALRRKKSRFPFKRWDVVLPKELELTDNEPGNIPSLLALVEKESR
ncbi:MAG: patatin-like phospholipase family protein [Spirochaetia bacterium]|nr:patatin-like phospholipase family protein [Spirochaetia bacterium]